MSLKPPGVQVSCSPKRLEDLTTPAFTHHIINGVTYCLAIVFSLEQAKGCLSQMTGESIMYCIKQTPGLEIACIENMVQAMEFYSAPIPGEDAKPLAPLLTPK